MERSRRRISAFEEAILAESDATSTARAFAGKNPFNGKGSGFADYAGAFATSSCPH